MKSRTYIPKDDEIKLSPDGRFYLNIKVSPKKTVRIDITEIIVETNKIGQQVAFDQGYKKGIFEANQTKKKKPSLILPSTKVLV